MAEEGTTVNNINNETNTTQGKLDMLAGGRLTRG
jgi:hypothetical protein